MALAPLERLPLPAGRIEATPTGAGETLHYLVGEAGDAGYVSWTPHEHHHGAARIRGAMIREDMRRRGIGRALVEAALVAIKSRGFATCRVLVLQNEAAVAFWGAMGFHPSTDGHGWTRKVA